MASQLRRFHGTVVSWKPEAGFGFVKIDMLGQQAMLHLNSFDQAIGGDMIKRDMRITFYIENHSRGLRCIRSEIIES